MYFAWMYAFFVAFCLATLIHRSCGKSLVNHGHRHEQTGFVNKEKLEVNREDAFIRLKMPSIVNDTQNSTVYVIVLGSPACDVIQVPKYLREVINMTNYQTSWIAASFIDPDSRPTEYLIGKDPTDNSSINCPLYPNETYQVVVAIDPYNETYIAVTISLPIRPTTDEGSSNLMYLSILLAIVICFSLIFVLRWRHEQIYARMKILRSLISNNHGNHVLLLPVTISIDKPLDCFSHSVEIEEFEHYVKGAVEKGELEAQFKMLPQGMVRSCQCGSLPNNKSKNRDQNLLAYDDTRVILGKCSLGSNNQSDYINANYIQGYCKEKAYIATQGPVSTTVVDFWRMIWQEEVRVICMMVNVIEGGKKTCDQYWPEVRKTVEYGNITVLNLKQRVYADYIHRTFQLTTRCVTESRKVQHLQYTGWPDQGVPMYSHSIVEYLNLLRAIPPGPGPVVVHCSTGTGRTGTIILCDITLRHAAAEGMVDVFSEAKKMYSARANMLEIPQQYVLAHLLPTQCLLLLSTKLPCSNVTPEKIEELQEHLQIHMQRLEASSWMDEALRLSEPLRLPVPKHIAKNRFPKLIPVERSLVTLKRYPPHDRNSDYISAVSVDGVRVKKQYIASQLPLSTTLCDFWRLVAEKKVELVIILQRPGPEDYSCVDVIPDQGMFFIPVPYLKVDHETSLHHSEHYTMDQLLLTDISKGEARLQTVTVLTCNNWSLADNAKPPPPEALVELWSASEGISRAERPTLVICRDGVTGCGLYLALSFLLERMAVEQECDVILAVRAIRRSRPEFVVSKEQFEYLYDAAVKFLGGFETYANFA